jgi:hypothetical protein
MKNEFIEMLNTMGIFPASTTTGLMTKDIRKRIMTNDAALVTAPNNGVPAWLLQYVDPRVIEILTKPLRAERIFKPQKRGDWTTRVMQFSQVEHTGTVEPYGDYSVGGETDINVTYPTRDSYYFETTLRYGDRQMAEYGQAKIDYRAQKAIAAAKTIKIAHNTIWFNGVAGINNYGILNAPGIPSPIAPIPYGTGTPVTTWADKAAIENGANGIYEDIKALFRQLITQSSGLISMDDPMKLVMSNEASVYLATKTTYGESVFDSLKRIFPALEVVTASEYSTAAGELVQLIANEVEGVETGILAYTELERSHGVIRAESSYTEKKSAGSWGTIVFRPFAIAGMLGV